MISPYDQERIKNVLDRFMEARSGIGTSTPDLMNYRKIVTIIGYDLPEAEDQFRIFLERHEDDSIVVGQNPLRIKYTMPASRDPEQRVLKDNFVRRQKRFREGRWPEQRPSRKGGPWKH